MCLSFFNIGFIQVIFLLYSHFFNSSSRWLHTVDMVDHWLERAFWCIPFLLLNNLLHYLFWMNELLLVEMFETDRSPTSTCGDVIWLLSLLCVWFWRGFCLEHSWSSCFPLNVWPFSLMFTGIRFRFCARFIVSIFIAHITYVWIIIISNCFCLLHLGFCCCIGIITNSPIDLTNVLQVSAFLRFRVYFWMEC